jgi:hypothetical protein
MPGKRPLTPRLPFVKGSSTHDLLMLAASQRRGKEKVLTPEIAVYVMAKFTNANKVREVASRLCALGLLNRVGDDQWQITQQGEMVLYEATKRPARIKSRS